MPVRRGFSVVGQQDLAASDLNAANRDRGLRTQPVNTSSGLDRSRDYLVNAVDYRIRLGSEAGIQ